jgi:hypothetical protein
MKRPLAFRMFFKASVLEQAYVLTSKNLNAFIALTIIMAY